MELTVDVGKGYVPSRPPPADAPIGLIPIDALYSPVRQVASRSRIPASARNSIRSSR